QQRRAPSGARHGVPHSPRKGRHMKHVIPPAPKDAIDAASAWCLRLAGGRLTPEARSGFDRWMSNPENARAFDDVTRTWQALERTSASPELIEMRRSALEAFRRGNATQWSRFAPPSPKKWLAAAAVLVAVAGAMVWWHLQPDRYETPYGERRV